MGWAKHYIEKLKNGESVSFRPRGNSMQGKISSGQLITVNPVEEKDLKKGDIVLCTVKGNDYVHLITAVKGVKGSNCKYQISNNHGYVNGWVAFDKIYGIVELI
jgi:hypothetical protein